MNLLAVVGHHAYAATAGALFLGACGIPMPVSVVLLVAGASAHGAGLNLSLVVLCGLVAAVTGDTLLYLGGRRTGWWLLAALCWVSLNPETCIFGSANSFHRRGPKTLLFSKFVPGLSTVAAPLSGSLNMPASKFLSLDVLGALIYSSVWAGAGWIGAPVLRSVIVWVQRLGHVTAAMVTAVLILYVLWLVMSYVRDTKFTDVERIAAAELHMQLQEGARDRIVVIADVRSHGYYDPGTQRIKNSIRVEPNRLKEELAALREFMAPECDIYLYCSCARDATSVRVAKALEKEDCKTKVIAGGLRAWIKAGGPLEPVPETDLEQLPQFE